MPAQPHAAPAAQASTSVCCLSSEAAGELEALDEVFARYAAERRPGEHLGDFTILAGIIREVTEGRLSND